MTNNYHKEHENTLTIYSMFFDRYKYRYDKNIKSRYLKKLNKKKLIFGI